MVHFSLGGTTARVAEAVAAGLAGAGCDAELRSLTEGERPDPGGYDLLGICTPTHYFRPPFAVGDYALGLPDLRGLPVFVVLLHGTYPGDAGTTLRRILAGKGGREVGYFRCRGADNFLGYLKEGYLFSPDHPDGEELARAAGFGRALAGRLAGEEYRPPPEDPPPALVYRLERLLTCRWLVRHLHSRMFRLDRGRCTACGLCRRRCPTRNIGTDGEGRPTWGRDCLLCLECELRCPVEAITSPVCRREFRPSLRYNVLRAARDPGLDHVRVTHRRGRTERLPGPASPPAAPGEGSP
jgi:NAD-dependent dihydropyrimidine dehydrogenase PreA subunit/flavodoxin